ncbi:male sterility protein-domain-containing protein [Mycena latifolia]|nr:male sterility protein-domain-containing protein [Mycena latifolia]
MPGLQCSDSELRSLESTFFRGQTIFLTGGTGGLGGCLLYMLALDLNTADIYVLVRGSADRAREQWRQTMAHEIDRILATGKIHFVVGDITAPAFGISFTLLAEMAQRVTVVIHSAGNINLAASLRASVRDNCLPALELARLASSFPHLVRFVHISSAYVNSFLPDGPVEERIYDTGNPEAQLHEILKTGALTSDGPQFPWPYSCAKHLTERLLFARFPALPTLIVRPTLIGPALARPHPFYSPPGAHPVSTYMRAYFAAPDSGIARATGTNIVDELPVDLVANLVLLHAAHGTAGVVHASAQICGARSLAALHGDMRATGMAAEFSYVSDPRVREGPYARLWRVAGRDWRFYVGASERFKGYAGALSIDVGHRELEQFMKERARRIADEVRANGKAQARL